MERQAVVSSNIASVGYEVLTKTLEIEFHNNKVYQYYDVTLFVYEELMSASSHGKYFDQNIKNAGYSYLQVE